MKSRLLFAVLACLVPAIAATAIIIQIVKLSAASVREEIGSQIAGVDRRINQHERVLADLITAVPYPYLQALTVRVDIGGGCGTGILVTRQIGEVTRTFVWTAGHVVARLRNEDGTFRNAIIYQEKREKGQYKGKSRVEAKVIAYSDPDVGEDLALLEILRDNFCHASISAVFLLDAEISPVGTELIHVGCTLGLYNSVSRGIISQTDRDVLGTGTMFDQTSCMGYPGSSGGGVYRSKDGKCIGLLVRGAGPGVNFIVPTRRMLVWAKKMKIEWAINAACPVPTHVVRDPNTLADGTEPKPIVAPEPPTPKHVIAAIIDALRKLIRDIAARSCACPPETA